MKWELVGKKKMKEEKVILRNPASPQSGHNIIVHAGLQEN
jgi:hypothetical protein